MSGTSCKAFLWQFKLIIWQFSHWYVGSTPTVLVSGWACVVWNQENMAEITLWLLRLDHERLWVFWLVCCNELCDEKFDYAEAFKLERPNICVQLHFPPIFSKVPLVYVQKPPWKWVSRLSCSSSSCWSYPQMRPKILKNRNKLFSVWIHDPQSLWA